MDLAQLRSDLAAASRILVDQHVFDAAGHVSARHPGDPNRFLMSRSLAPESVTDIVVTHSHWDHMDGVDLFPKATIHIQRDEREYYVGPMGEVLHTGGVDADDAKMLAALADAGRVRLVEGDAREILPGLTAYTGGKHTWASQYVGVTTRDGVVVLASDNAYLYENLEGPRAIAQTGRHGFGESVERLQRPRAAHLLKHHQRNRHASADDHEQALAEIAQRQIENGRRHQQKEHRLFQRAQDNAPDAGRRRLRRDIGAIFGKTTRSFSCGEAEQAISGKGHAIHGSCVESR